MPFNTLLTRCLLQSNSFTENGVQVSVRRESDEVVLFFRLDESPFRSDMEHDGRLCDLAVFYKSDGPAVLCLVELKSGDYEDAADQLIETKRALLREFGKDSRRRSIANDMIFKCCIVYHHSVPTNKQVIKNLYEKLKIEFGEKGYRILT